LENCGVNKKAQGVNNNMVGSKQKECNYESWGVDSDSIGPRPNFINFSLAIALEP